jgi:leucyl-tRNA---protein transferase
MRQSRGRSIPDRETMHYGEIVVFDDPHPCAYLPERTARLPHRFPLAKLSPEEFDRRLEDGDRRSGLLLYRPQCPACQACEPIRLEVTRFAPGRTQRRVLRHGDACLDVRIGPPAVDRMRIDLFNKHRQLRRLEHGDGPIDEEGYAQFLSESCCDTWEISYYLGRRLVAVAVTDVGAVSLSAVYCYFDPDLAGLSLGTYSILKQANLCRETDRRFLYLGFFVAQSHHMVYKERFHPHQRRIGGQWRDFP